MMVLYIYISYSHNIIYEIPIIFPSYSHIFPWIFPHNCFMRWENPWTNFRFKGGQGGAGQGSKRLKPGTNSWNGQDAADCVPKMDLQSDCTYEYYIYIYHYISVFIHLVICACMHASICTYKLLRFLNTYYVYNIYIYINLWATVNISHIAPNHQFLKSVLSIVFQVWGI